MFRSNYSRLVRGITEPKLLAVDLFSKGLISEAVKNRVTTVTGVDTADRAIMLVDEVEARVKVDPRPAQVMRELCEVLETETALQPVSRSIRAALGKFRNVLTMSCNLPVSIELLLLLQVHDIIMLVMIPR